MPMVPWGLTWLLGASALQLSLDPAPKVLPVHRCVSTSADVTDAYCASVNCDPRFAKFCVWLDSPEALSVIITRDVNAKAGAGAADALQNIVNALGKTIPDTPAPLDSLAVTSVPQTDALASSDLRCWVPTAWYPKHECGNPNPSECSRGWSVFASKSECCEAGAAFTKGCDGFVADLKLKDKIINEVLGGDPRVAQDEAAWLRDMSLQRDKREAMMKFGYVSNKPHQVVAFDAGGSVPKAGFPPEEQELKPGPNPGVEPENKPPSVHDLQFSKTFHTGVFFTVTPNSAVPPLMSKKQFQEMFPYANFHAEPAIYTYENFIRATSYFPSFAGSGDILTRKRELAAFLAHVSQETSGWWSGQEYTWGLTYNRESGCGEARDACDIYIACHSESPYACAPGQHYYGRGPMMIAWNYNYGECSHYLYGDDRLLTSPDMVANDGVAAFMSALWFWMEPHGGYGKPSSHDAITGLWKPTGHDTMAGRAPGFGLTLNIVDGQQACLKDVIPDDASHRINYFVRYCSVLQTTPGPQPNCKAQIPFISDFGTPVEIIPETEPEIPPGTNITNVKQKIHTIGDRSYVQQVKSTFRPIEAYVAPQDKYKFLQSGRKCGESSRILLECGDCGPGLTDFESCKAMCDAHLQCRYFNYFNDKSCRLYTECSQTEINNSGVIYLKQSHLSQMSSDSLAPTWPVVGSIRSWNGEPKKRHPHQT